MKPINSYIDHTLLKPQASFQEIENLIKEALLYQFASVCIHPTWTKAAYPLLNESNVKLCSVVGFPLGANLTETKASEAKHLVDHGVQEIDMVMNIGDLKSKDYKKVQKDIEAVREASKNATLKVIIETCLLGGNFFKAVGLSTDKIIYKVAEDWFKKLGLKEAVSQIIPLNVIFNFLSNDAAKVSGHAKLVFAGENSLPVTDWNN